MLDFETRFCLKKFVNFARDAVETVDEKLFSYNCVRSLH